jgi:hypothetical protein
MKKIPGWFPIGAEEVPVPLLKWQGASREDSGVEQVVFTKKLSNGQLGATIVRASWTQLTPGNDLLVRTMQVREQELRRSYHVLKIETRGDDSVLPDCLRVDTLFEGNTEGNQHAVISSRRYLCAHPDAPLRASPLGRILSGFSTKADWRGSTRRQIRSPRTLQTRGNRMRSYLRIRALFGWMNTPQSGGWTRKRTRSLVLISQQPRRSA